MKHSTKPLPIYVGDRFGKWTVISDPFTETGRRRSVLCRCDCGTERAVPVPALHSGHTRSCKCAHGHSKTPLYDVWGKMVARCLDPRAKDYALYGGRGIALHAPWRDFRAFFADMGERPSDKHTLDRIDTNGPYSPENCRWATRLEQANNFRKNRFLTFRGKTQTVSMWAREVGLTPGCISGRIKTGWSVEDALTQRPDQHPVKGKRRMKSRSALDDPRVDQSGSNSVEKD